MALEVHTKLLAALPDSPEPVAPPEGAEATALVGLRTALHQTQSGAYLGFVGPDQQVVAVPSAVFKVLIKVVEAMARGDAVSIVPVHMQLTTRQAADILNVSRQYFVRLLEKGGIPYEMVGTHRRVRFDDLMAYKRENDAKRRSILRELTAEAEDIGPEY